MGHISTVISTPCTHTISEQKQPIHTPSLYYCSSFNLYPYGCLIHYRLSHCPFLFYGWRGVPREVGTPFKPRSLSHPLPGLTLHCRGPDIPSTPSKLFGLDRKAPSCHPTQRYQALSLPHAQVLCTYSTHTWHTNEQRGTNCLLVSNFNWKSYPARDASVSGMEQYVQRHNQWSLLRP